MNFFGNSNCGDINRECGNGCGMDCCSLLFLILLLQNCGCGCGNMKGGDFCIDCGTILFLMLLSNCGCSCSCK